MIGCGDIIVGSGHRCTDLWLSVLQWQSDNVAFWLMDPGLLCLPLFSWSGQTYNCQRYFTDNAQTTEVTSQNSLNVVFSCTTGSNRSGLLALISTELYIDGVSPESSTRPQDGIRLSSIFFQMFEVIQMIRWIKGDSRLPSLNIYIRLRARSSRQIYLRLLGPSNQCRHKLSQARRKSEDISVFITPCEHIQKWEIPRTIHCTVEAIFLPIKVLIGLLSRMIFADWLFKMGRWDTNSILKNTKGNVSRNCSSQGTLLSQVYWF